jgi:DnaJ-class molecular chaperone
MPEEEARPWHIVLRISESASMSEIKAAYRLRISEYHPDKVASMGEEIRVLAEKKSKEINLAYSAAAKLKVGTKNI